MRHEHALLQCDMTGGVSAPASTAVRRIALALVFSFLVHFLVLSNVGVFHLAGSKSPANPLQIKLVGIDRTPPATVEPPATGASAILVPPGEAGATPVKTPAPASFAAKQSSPDIVAKPAPAATPAAVPGSALPPVTDTGRADMPGAIPIPGLSGLVKRVEIGFEIFTGLERKLAGSGRHLYVSPDGGSYGVSIEQSPGKNAAPGSGGVWKINVAGRISSQGLSPIFYEVQGALSERLMALQTVPDLSSSRTDNPRKGRMQDGLLDRQSLLYQFMIRPPETGGGKLWLSDGIASGLYSYRFATFDSLPITVLGGLRAIKLVLSSSDSPETIELWVVPDMHYLPVKMRHVDRQGAITEQEAVSLDFSE